MRAGVLRSYDETLTAWFYYNTDCGDTQWDHPLDQVYRARVEEARRERARKPAEVCSLHCDDTK